MRSLTLASVFAFALSAWSVTSTTLDKGYDQLETIEAISDKYPSNTLEKRFSTSNIAYFGYACKAKFFSKEKIEETKKRACKELKSISRHLHKFPAAYKPKKRKVKILKLSKIKYLFPLRNKGYYPAKIEGDYRIVFNLSCHLLKVVKVKRDGSGNVKKNQFKDCIKAFKMHNQKSKS